MWLGNGGYGWEVREGEGVEDRGEDTFLSCGHVLRSCEGWGLWDGVHWNRGVHKVVGIWIGCLRREKT